MLWNFRVDKTELTWMFVNIAISHGSPLRGESFPRELERFSVSFCELVGQFWLVYIMVMLKNPDSGPRYSLVPAYGVAGPGSCVQTARGRNPKTMEREPTGSKRLPVG